MGLVVREADLDRELGLIQDLTNENFAMRISPARFRWMYLDNPEGRATAWFVCDEKTGEPIGTTAVFPRRVRLGSGERLTAWLCGDFSILKRYRTMGAALKLRRAAKDGVDRGVRPFLFAHPNDRMLAIHKQVGHRPLACLVRYAKPLRPRAGSKTIAAVGGWASRILDVAWLSRVRDEIEWRGETRFDEEFTRFYEEVAERLPTSVVRSATYLNWRFLDNPVEAAEVVALRRSGRLAGYCVFSTRDDVASIKDWLAADERAFREMLSGCIRGLRQRGVASVSMICLESHPDLPLFRRLGFMARPETSTAVAYAPEGWPGRDQVIRSDAWYMTVGDRDI